MSRKKTPVNVVFHFPETEEGKQALAKKIADVHADVVYDLIKKQNCPSEQKTKLLNAVIKAAKESVD